MIEKKLRTTTGMLKLCLPDMLAEISFGQMMALQEKPGLSDLEAIEILTGVPLSQLQNVKDINDFQVFADAVLSLSRQIKYLYNNDAIPQKITFKLGEKSRTVSVIQNLSVEPVGAFMAARDIIGDEIDSHIKKYGPENFEVTFHPSLRACCQVLAHYFYCPATGELYNEYKAEEFGTEIKKLRVTEALPVAKHFFMLYPNLSKPKISFFRRLLPHSRKKQAFNRSKSLNISTP